MAQKKYIEPVSIIHLICCDLDTHKDKIGACLIYEQDNAIAKFRYYKKLARPARNH